MHSH